MSFMTMLSRKFVLPSAAEALPGRAEPVRLTQPHAVLGRPLTPPWPEGMQAVCFGMGCFWGAERAFWSLEGVHVTAAGYAGGHTPNPTYNEVCTGRTAHAEVVLVVHDPRVLPLAALLKLFWERHDPTEGMRQGNDVGTQYRSVIYLPDEAALAEAEASRAAYAGDLQAAGHTRAITTELATGVPFYFAEDYHQQYLAKNPNGYCGLRGTGVICSPAAHMPESAEESGA
ncbi:peptide-methionine (S)-S-oxide reductase MsrA [Pannonibacter phragmitetus]|uniref:peptide-methionine (S)-S-oxide reductase MsrA n=1 Tax=Pannonibacter phragmitetus TaxID=121719 RepID=UPI000F448831|nr:peptide-methionine (S)-S-oxide reductase MsrA [Pannonibacter phragmitetus]MBA4207544.1 peptide-methionine (S)-S-oxide reductase [Polymorphum sp.]